MKKILNDAVQFIQELKKLTEFEYKNLKKFDPMDFNAGWEEFKIEEKKKRLFDSK